jgi:hypothetical protein
LLEAAAEQLRLKTEAIEKEALHVNAERKKGQEQSRSQFEKMTRRRDEAIGMPLIFMPAQTRYLCNLVIGLTWQVKAQCDAMEEELARLGKRSKVAEH